MLAPEDTLRLLVICGWQTMPMALATVKAFLEMVLLSFRKWMHYFALWT